MVQLISMHYISEFDTNITVKSSKVKKQIILFADSCKNHKPEKKSK
jgi:hypothetical protein